MSGQQNETEKTGDTTIRETGHDARSDASERAVQRVADQQEARAGTLLPEQTPRDAGHMPDGDKAGPQAGQEHEVAQVGQTMRMHREGNAAGAGHEVANAPSATDPNSANVAGDDIQRLDDHYANARIQSMRINQPTTQTANKMAVADDDQRITTMRLHTPAPTKPDRPKVSRDHETVLTYIEDYVHWMFHQRDAADRVQAAVAGQGTGGRS